MAGVTKVINVLIVDDDALVRAGLTMMLDGADGIAATDAGTQERARAALAALSRREHEVVVAVAKGRTNAEIAAELYMSVATVKAHISRILTKLSLGNRTQIALLAHDAGLA